MTHRIPTTLVLLALTAVASPGCDDAESTPPRSAATAPAPAPAPDITDAPAPSPVDPVAEAAALDPAAARARLAALAPVETRAGALRFTDPILERPEAAEVFLARLADPAIPALLRPPLAEALPRCGGAWAAGAAAQAEREADPEVLALLLAGMRRADPAIATPALQRGLADPHPEVRRAAAESAGWNAAAGDSLRPELRARLDDDDAGVRAAAARALGLRGDAESFQALADRLGDRDPEVRVQLLHALERIDARRAADLAGVHAALADPEAGPRRAAELLRSAATITR